MFDKFLRRVTLWTFVITASWVGSKRRNCMAKMANALVLGSSVCKFLADSGFIPSNNFRITSWHKSGQRNFTIFLGGEEGWGINSFRTPDWSLVKMWWKFHRSTALSPSVLEGDSREISFENADVISTEKYGEAGDDGFLETAIPLNLLIRRCFSGNYRSIFIYRHSRMWGVIPLRRLYETDLDPWEIERERERESTWCILCKMYMSVCEKFIYIKHMLEVYLLTFCGYG